jgi:hypothetical protein
LLRCHLLVCALLAFTPHAVVRASATGCHDNLQKLFGWYAKLLG